MFSLLSAVKNVTCILVGSAIIYLYIKKDQIICIKFHHEDERKWSKVLKICSKIINGF